MATVMFDSVTRIFDKGSKPAINDLSLDIADGEFLVLVGPSGCGKSTSLRMLAGLEPINSGSIEIDGKNVTGVNPADRDVAMVFQNYALYPNMTVAENMSFALRNRGMKKGPAREKVDKAAEILQLEELLERKPSQLSGGQRQRVAMGRAIVREPAVFCMDEPLSNLDAKLRVTTRAQISALQRRLRTTTVYVTHDQTEAMTMGDRVAVLNKGVLQQVDSPRTLYDRPSSLFVAGFIGSPAMNLYRAAVRDNRAEFGSLLLDLGGSDQRGADFVAIGLRPEHMRLSNSDTGLRMKVLHVEELGYESFAFGRFVDYPDLTTTTNLDGHTGVRASVTEGISVGDEIYVDPDPNHIHVFNAETELREN